MPSMHYVRNCMTIYFYRLHKPERRIQTTSKISLTDISLYITHTALGWSSQRSASISFARCHFHLCHRERQESLEYTLRAFRVALQVVFISARLGRPLVSIGANSGERRGRAVANTAGRVSPPVDLNSTKTRLRIVFGGNCDCEAAASPGPKQERKLQNFSKKRITHITLNN